MVEETDSRVVDVDKSPPAGDAEGQRTIEALHLRLDFGQQGLGEGHLNTGTILVTRHLHIYVYNIVLGIHLHISSRESVIMLNS